MSTHTISGYIVHETWSFNTVGKFAFQDSKARKNEHVTQIDICPLEISFEVPDDFDPRPVQVAALEAQKQEMRAKFAAAVKEIDDRISSLLALEMSA